MGQGPKLSVETDARVGEMSLAPVLTMSSVTTAPLGVRVEVWTAWEVSSRWMVAPMLVLKSSR